MKTRMMTGLIPDPQGQAVEFMSDRDQLADRDRVAAVSCLANIQVDRGLNRLRRSLIL
jgi:hypothetical protein